MTKPARVDVRASLHQYQIVCYSGPLDPWLDRLVEWNQCDHLITELARATRQVGPAQFEEMRQGLRRFGDVTRWDRCDFSLAFFALNLHVAERGLMGLRSAEGLHCQLFRQGWAVTPPFVADAASDVGLVIIAAFGPDRIPGIPLSRAALDAELYEPARALTTLEWSDEDEPCWSCRDEAWQLEVESERHSGTPLTPDGRVWRNWPRRPTVE